MSPARITICIVNYNTARFIETLLFALQKLTVSPFKVMIRDNNSSWSDYVRLQKIAAKYPNVTLYRVGTALKGSSAHGDALNDLFSRIDTHYGAIIDPDAMFLVYGWDEILMSELSEKVPIFGTQADIGGGKPLDFPLVFAALFLTEPFKKMSLDFNPKHVVANGDTGWELREKCIAAGVSGKILYDFNTRIHKEGPFADVVCSEYYMEPVQRGTIFASHFGRGSAPRAKNLLYIRSMKSNIFLKVANKLLHYPNIVKWRHDRKKWLSICQNIVRAQVRNAKA